MRIKTPRYYSWITVNEPTQHELAAQREKVFGYAPKISVAVPVYNNRPVHLEEMIESVLAQTYQNWELCIADVGSESSVAEILLKYVSKDKRIKVRTLPSNEGISHNSNAALELASGEFIALLDQDSLLAPFALFEVVRLINEKPSAEFIYSDQDSVTEDGKTRFSPFFKPDWSPDLLRAHNYISHLAVIKKELLERTGGFRKEFDGSQDHDLFLRLSENTAHIEHIPKVLYHWRVHALSTALNNANKSYALPAGIRAIEEHIKRIGLSGDVEAVRPSGFYRVNYALQSRPKVSIIIPNKDSVKILKKCLDSIFGKTAYKNFEVLIVENNSTEEKTFSSYKDLSRQEKIKVLYYGDIFNYSRINNFAASKAEGEVLLFLNNDTEVIAPDWIERMLGFALRSDVGAVGALLLYPDKSIQHAGVLAGYGVPVHYHQHAVYGDDGYFGSLVIARNVSAVTAACVMVRREVFSEIGGFDEDFQVAFGDVDFCLKMRDKGYLNVFTPDAVLYHHESKTRGYEDTPEKVMRFNRELNLLRMKWKSVLEKSDPYYSPNLSINGNYAIGIPGIGNKMDKIIKYISSINPGIARFILWLRRKIFFIRIYIRPKLIKSVDFFLKTPKMKQKIRFYYHKIF